MAPTSLASMYNLQTPMGSGLEGLAKPGPDDANTPKWWHPDSPLFWLFVIAGATFGLIGASVSVGGHAGPVHAGVDVGAGKK